MTTIAWLLILIGIIIARMVVKGRTAHVSEDLSDAILAILRGDTGELGAVLARTGDTNEATPVDLSGYEPAGSAAINAAAAAGAASSGLAAVAKRLGSAARGYKFTKTGPDYYDCSGLMYAAVRELGYKGGRFTTFTIASNKAFQHIGAPAANTHDAQGRGRAGVNDLVVWPTHHMGVITGPNTFYSARNPKAGIGEAKISGFRSSAPIYLRYIGNG